MGDLWGSFGRHLRLFEIPMRRLSGTSEVLLGTYGAVLGKLWGTSEDLWGTFGGHVRHFGGPMGHLWATSEALWATHGTVLGDI